MHENAAEGNGRGRRRRKNGDLDHHAAAGVVFLGRRPNGFLRLSLNDRTILFLVIVLDKTVSVR